MSDVDTILEIIGAKLDDEVRREELFNSQGRTGMSDRSDGAVCALREVLSTLVDRYKFGREMEGEIPLSLKEWDERGCRPYSWKLPGQ